MPTIHPTAVVDPRAELAADVEIGPHVVIDGCVRIGQGTRIIAQAHLCGHTTIGPGCVIHPFAAIGGPPQDQAYKGERSYCRIGARVVIRESVTVHCGTMPESITTIGDDCMLMAGSHVAHNCTVAEHVILINAALLGGHVQVGHHAVIGGAGAAHQFVRIGEYVMVGGGARLTQDAAPFMCYVERNECPGVNRVGLRRNGFPKETIDELHGLHRALFRSGRPMNRVAAMFADSVTTDAGRRLLAFVLEASRRGIGGVGDPPVDS